MGTDPTRRSVFAAIGAPFILPSLGIGDGTAPPKGYKAVGEFGARGDGTSDDTDALSLAHASGDPIYYPRTAAFYRISRQLDLGASTLSNGAQIRIAGDGSNQKTIFRVTQNRHPLAISGFVLDGGYDGGSKGEFSMGVCLYGAKDITISGNRIQNPYGDCVYVGSADGSSASTNIRIHGNQLINPRRCNVAVVCGDNVIIDGNTCEKPVDYVAGIDLEPDPNGFDHVRDVRVANNSFMGVKFISAGVNNGVDNSGLSIAGNTGRALIFFHGWENARLRDVTIARNRFSATAANGAMLILEGVQGGGVTGNIDQTPCANGYHSVRISNCDIRLDGNKFCV